MLIKLTRANGTKFVVNAALIADVSEPVKANPDYPDSHAVLTYTTYNKKMDRMNFDFVQETPEEVAALLGL